MEDDNIAILTLPYTNDLSSLYNQTNNSVALVLIVVQVISLLLNLLGAYLLPLNDFKSKYNLPSTLFNSYSIIIYCHLILWILMLIIKFYLKGVYYKRLRIIGFHKHHKLVSFLIVCPSFILHKANAVLLLATIILWKLDKDALHIGNLHLQHYNVPQIIISLGTTIILPFLIKLLYLEIKFRQLKNPPDVFCVDDPQHLEQAGLSETVTRSSTFLEDLLEKQADLIYNLKLQNSHLRMMLFKVSQQRSNTETANL